jgi:peptidoglycan/LPS O-acetylase OafA/YrhL
VFFHDFFGIEMSNLLTTLIAHGYLAVDLFFVLSGFVMALNYGSLFETRMSFLAYRRFLGRRIARIYPFISPARWRRLGWQRPHSSNAFIQDRTAARVCPRRLLSLPAVEWLGLLSYSIDLFHDLMGVPLTWILTRATELHILHAQTAGAVVCFMPTFPVAWLAYTS